MAFLVGSTTELENRLLAIERRVDGFGIALQSLLALAKSINSNQGVIMTSQENFNAKVSELDVTLDVIRAGVQGLTQHAANLEAVVGQLREQNVDVSGLDAVVAEANELAAAFRPVVVPSEPTPTTPEDFPTVDPVEGADPVEELPTEDAPATDAPAEEAPATGDTGAADDEVAAPAEDAVVDEAPAPADTGTVGEVPEAPATDDGSADEGTTPNA